jgi:hypothetical protein
MGSAAAVLAGEELRGGAAEHLGGVEVTGANGERGVLQEGGAPLCRVDGLRDGAMKLSGKVGQRSCTSVSTMCRSRDRRRR